MNVAKSYAKVAKCYEKHLDGIKQIETVKNKKENDAEVAAFIKDFAENEDNIYRQLLDATVKQGKSYAVTKAAVSEVQAKGLRKLGFYVLKHDFYRGGWTFSHSDYYIFFHYPFLKILRAKFAFLDNIACCHHSWYKV